MSNSDGNPCRYLYVSVTPGLTHLNPKNKTLVWPNSAQDIVRRHHANLARLEIYLFELDPDTPLAVTTLINEDGSAIETTEILAGCLHRIAGTLSDIWVQLPAGIELPMRTVTTREAFAQPV